MLDLGRVGRAGSEVLGVRTETAAAAGATDIIEVEGLSHFFPLEERTAHRDTSLVKALEKINLSIPERHFTALVGTSGCGKTTLLNILAGLEPLQSGRVDVCGRAPQHGHEDLAYMPARDALMPWRSVIDNASFGLEVRGVAKNERYGITRPILEAVGLGRFENARPRQLSHGMRQRVALARTFALPSRILLMDEPFGALDAQTKQQLQSVLLDLWETDRRTVVLVTHDLQEAITLSDRVIVMSARPGRIKADFSIDIPRPRHVGELVGLPEFISLYQEIRSLVEEGD